jgi:hypothetical protein
MYTSFTFKKNETRRQRKNYYFVSSDVQSMQKCFMRKLYLRETTLFLHGCTIFTVFVTTQLLWRFVPLKKSKSIPKLQIRQQDKRFYDENVVLALSIFCIWHS